MVLFKTPEQLGIPEAEHAALVEVLRMLESSELTYVEYTNEGWPRGRGLFNMAVDGSSCGTPACIGGWVARLLELDATEYIARYKHSYRLGGKAPRTE